MMKKKRKRIALVLNWYDTRLHDGVLRYGSKHNWDIYDFHRRPDDARSFNGDGLIVLPGPGDVYGELAERFKNRTVVVGVKPTNPSVPSVIPDDYAIGQCAADHLLGRGYQNLAVVSPWQSWFVDARTEGFTDKAKSAGVEVLDFCYNRRGPTTLPDDWDKDLGQWFFNVIGSLRRPLGMYSPLDSWAQLLVRACSEFAIPIPEELALVGTNNDPVICPYTDVPLSSVDMNWSTIGFNAGEQLDRVLAGQPIQSVKVAPIGVITRRSSDGIAIPDIRVARAVRYIQDHLFEKISASRVAEAVHVPLRTLQLGFRKHLRRGIREEITRRRIDEIKRLLRETDMTASQIADQLNYTTVFPMLRLFKHNSGMTTRQFRARATERTQ